MLIAIPSKGRAGKVRTLDFLGTGTVFVPANEVEAYREGGARDVVAVPLAVRGITRTRNFILDRAAAAGERWTVFVDDDLEKCGWVELGETSSRTRDITPSEMIEEWVRLFEVAVGLGFRVWGVSTDGATRSVYPYRPLIFRTYVTASCMGIVSDGSLRFDEAFPVKEDYELCLRAVREDGGVLGARYLFWRNSHWRDVGGCHDYRTQEMERDAVARLMSMYPGQVRWAPNRESKFSIAVDF